MTVKEAIDLIGYGERYMLKGAMTGQIYHKSYVHTAKHLEPLLNKEVADSPFFTALHTRNDPGCAYAYPVIGIWITG